MKQKYHVLLFLLALSPLGLSIIFGIENDWGMMAATGSMVPALIILGFKVRTLQENYDNQCTMNTGLVNNLADYEKSLETAEKYKEQINSANDNLLEANLLYDKENEKLKLELDSAIQDLTSSSAKIGEMEQDLADAAAKIKVLEDTDYVQQREEDQAAIDALKLVVDTQSKEIVGLKEIVGNEEAIEALKAQLKKAEDGWVNSLIEVRRSNVALLSKTFETAGNEHEKVYTSYKAFFQDNDPEMLNCLEILYAAHKDVVKIVHQKFESEEDRSQAFDIAAKGLETQFNRAMEASVADIFDKDLTDEEKLVLKSKLASNVQCFFTIVNMEEAATELLKALKEDALDDLDADSSANANEFAMTPEGPEDPKEISIESDSMETEEIVETVVESTDVTLDETATAEEEE